MIFRKTDRRNKMGKLKEKNVKERESDGNTEKRERKRERE